MTGSHTWCHFGKKMQNKHGKLIRSFVERENMAQTLFNILVRAVPTGGYNVCFKGNNQPRRMSSPLFSLNTPYSHLRYISKV